MAGKAGSSGGKRTNAGRRKGEKAITAVVAPQILAPVGSADPGFFTRVLARMGEGKPAVIKSAEDYALDLLFRDDVQTRSYNFNKFLDHIHGRPAQGVFVGDTREVSRPLIYGNMPRAISAPKPGGDRKPN